MSKNPWPRPNKDLCQAIGKLAVHWSHIEHLIHSIIPGLLKSDGQSGYMLSRNLGNRTIQEFLLTLSSEIEDQHLSNGVKNIANEFDRLLGLRNRIIHNLWLPQSRGSSKETRVALLSRFRGKARHSVEVWRLEQINSVIQQCIEFQYALECFTLDTDLIDPVVEWHDRKEKAGEPMPLSHAQFRGRDPKVEEWMQQLPPYRK